jgi:LysR family transcriptional regulator, transcription activator of glutamate synthase operon
MGVDTRALRWFQLVADGATVTEVSETEHTTQSGVSRALARLEAEVGAPLLRRAGRTLRMTHAGAAFKHHVDALMHHLDDGLAAVHQLVDPASGTVTLSYQPSMGTWLVPDLISSFRPTHPDVVFELRPKRDELVTSVHAGSDVDLELSTLPPRDPAVRWRLLARERLLLAVPPGHPLAARSQVALDELADSAFVALRATSQLRHLSDQLCAEAGFSPAIAFECDDLPTVRGFVAAGLGVAVLPAPAGRPAAAEAGQPRYLALTDRGAAREVGMAWSVDRRMLPSARRFGEHVVARADSGLLPAASAAGGCLLDAAPAVDIV